MFLYQTFIFNQKLTHSFLKLLLLNFIIYTILSGIFRFLLRDLLTKIYFNENIQNAKIKKRVLIYGAGSAGGQLAASLRHNNIYKIFGFLDE